jgi:hypothetical protein
MDYSLESDYVRQLDRDILDYVKRGLDNCDTEGFNRLALREFELHYHTVTPYRRFCQDKGAMPGNIERWEQIPAVPSMAFKKFVMTSFPEEQAEQRYFTSGTTDPLNKGKIMRDSGGVELINTANGLLTREYLFPDIDRMKMLLMVPSPQMAPGMGMAVGLDVVRRMFGTDCSSYLIGPTGLNLELLLKSIVDAERSDEPLVIVGSTAGFVYFLKACERDGIRFRLPPGSRLCDGGGYLDQFGECSRDEFYLKSREILGVEEHHCVNVLGMGEISTNFFDNVLRDNLKGNPLSRYKVVPPWTRTQVVDVGTFEPVEHGSPGLLRHYDLINRSMVVAVQTDNVGVAVDDGFEIIGRWKKNSFELETEAITQSHGGRFMTQLIEFLLKRSLKKVGRIYEKIAKN